MQAYCFRCRRHSGNIGSKRLIITNKVVTEKSRCANCMFNKYRFLKTKSG